MVCLTVKQTGTSCSQRNVSHAGSPWRPATGGSRRSTITTTVSASTARCAKRTSKDRVSSPKEVGHSVRFTPAKSPQRIIYNSDTVYSTMTFRPVSPSPITPPPQRTRKLETPLHFDGGLFSDIRSTEGKLLSTVTVDRVQRETRHDVTDSPNAIHVQDANNYVDDIFKTETITNKDVITVKFTPVPPELDSPRLLTPSQFLKLQSHTPEPVKQYSPVEYLKDNYEDLQSYKIVSSVCKDQLFESEKLSVDKVEKSVKFDLPTEVEDSFTTDVIDSVKLAKTKTDLLDVMDMVNRPHSPLANILVSEQLTRIDNYLQEGLDVCLGRKSPSMEVLETRTETKQSVCQVYKENSAKFESNTVKTDSSVVNKNDSYHKEPESKLTEKVHPTQSEEKYVTKRSKSNSVVKRTGVFNAMYKMPIHYHAAILCLLLIVYNLIYQYYKQNKQK